MLGFFRKSNIEEVSPDTASQSLLSESICLVDVRERSEWEREHIPGAVLAPLSRLHLLAPELPSGKPIVFCCRSGARSAQAVAICQKLGLPHNTHVKGGILAWRAEGLPITN